MAGKPRIFIDHAGQRFGRLLVLSRVPKKGYWNSICDCGNMTTSSGTHLLRGIAQSFGCLQKDAVTSHGLSRSPEYRAWYALKSRCLNKNTPQYVHYGAKGITICDKWVNSFAQFFEDMGKRPSPKHSLDRIDVNGNYSHANCRWATATVQCHNKRKRKSKLGIQGVYQAGPNSFRATISLNMKNHYLGTFRTACEAEAAYLKTKREHLEKHCQ